MTNYKPSNPKDRAATHRLDLTLFPQSAIVYGALGMTEGDAKYGGYNYRVAGVSVSTYIAAAMRHIFKFYNGEWEDPKTKVPHLGSILSCIAIIVDGFTQDNIQDDRPPRQQTSMLVDSMEEKVRHLHEIFKDGPKRYTERSKDVTKLPISDYTVSP